MAQPAEAVPAAVQATPGRHSQAVVKEAAARELVFGVVGHVGSGTSAIATMLSEILEAPKLTGGPYKATVLKARDEIVAWAAAEGRAVPEPDATDLGYATTLQDLGDAMRDHAKDNSAVARALIRRIRLIRATAVGADASSSEPVVPDGIRRAYILDSIRHPAEVEILRRVYTNAFTLIGVVCDEQKRQDRLGVKYKNAGAQHAATFMKRDAKAKEMHGQRVSDAFHLSDAFLDNTEERYQKDKTPNPDWDIADQLSRLVNIISHGQIVRPTSAETAMYTAHGAQMRSACLSRQVGAALVDSNGSVVAIGSNEVPRAGGGLYGEGFSDQTSLDSRCAYRAMPGGAPRFCSNTSEQVVIAADIVEILEKECGLNKAETAKAVALIRSSRIGELIEFSRAVHAEMDALLSAARRRVSPVGCRLFVTTFPCHYCARHLVSSGIDEVQFIEPYPKSKALDLHSDSIVRERSGWKPPSEGGTHVLFRPFTGVAPRMYARAFLKSRDLKDNVTGELAIGMDGWTGAWDVARISYPQLEVDLLSNEREERQ
jgi:deoxycytidylate deaminase